MTVQEKIDRLKSDIAIHKEALQVYEQELAHLEEQADAWREAKNWCNHWESHFSEPSPQRKIVSYVRHLENSLAAAEENKLTEPLCPRRIVATAAIVMQQSMEFLIKTKQIDPLPGFYATHHTDAIRLLKQAAGTEAKPYKTIAVEDLDVCP